MSDLKTTPEERAAVRRQSSGIPGSGSELAARLADDIDTLAAEVDCGQQGPCAVAPGCNRHWEERNRELAAEVGRLEAELRKYRGELRELLRHTNASYPRRGRLDIGHQAPFGYHVSKVAYEHIAALCRAANITEDDDE